MNPHIQMLITHTQKYYSSGLVATVKLTHKINITESMFDNKGMFKYFGEMIPNHLKKAFRGFLEIIL